MKEMSLLWYFSIVLSISLVHRLMS
jgi:hypothetical protein